MSTLLRRILSCTPLHSRQVEAIMACVEVGYEGCPDDIAAIMGPLMKVDILGGEKQPTSATLAAALDDARRRCSCRYLCLSAGSEDGKVKGAMMLNMHGGLSSLLRPFTLDMWETEAITWLDGLTNEACAAALGSIAAKEVAGSIRGAFIGAAELTVRK